MGKENLNASITIRLTPAERARLESLAAATGRRPSAVLRRLLALATPSGVPDVTLAGGAARQSQQEVRR